MGYKLNGKDLPLDTPFTDSQGTNYPANWLRLASNSERAAVPTGGITWVDPVVEEYDREFYTGKDKPKDIAALKSSFIQKQKDQANGLLSLTDWMIVRQAEGGTAAPSDTKTYRAAVRTVCKEREDQITACSDTAALCALIRESVEKPEAGTASNGAVEKKKEKFDTSKEVFYTDYGSGDKKSYDPKRYEPFSPKQYESYDPKQYEVVYVQNPNGLKRWPTS